MVSIIVTEPNKTRTRGWSLWRVSSHYLTDLQDSIFTYEEHSLPVVRSSGNRNLEVHPSLGLREGRHDAGGPVLVHPPPVRVLGVEPARDLLSRLEAGPGQVDPGAAQHVPVLRGEDQRQVGADRDPVEIPDTHTRQDLLIYPEDVSPLEPISSPRVGKVSDLRCLGVRFVLVSPRPVASVEANEGGDPALSHGGVPTGLGVGRPTHPLVVEDGVGSDLVRDDDGLEGVGLTNEKNFRKRNIRRCPVTVLLA